MPKIITSTCEIIYKVKPLYEGVKRIDKKKAAENLSLLNDALKKNNLHLTLLYGTLLGAIRNNDFIDHDEDIDIGFLEEDKERVLNSLPALQIIGFSVARYDRKGLLSIIRNNEYIDVYFFKSTSNGLRSASGVLVLESFLKNTIPFIFKGVDCNIPRDYERFLICEYGLDWRIPVEWNDYNQSPWKIKFYNLKMKIKDNLPDCLYFPISNYYERRLEKKSIDRINTFLRSHAGKI